MSARGWCPAREFTADTCQKDSRTPTPARVPTLGAVWVAAGTLLMSLEARGSQQLPKPSTSMSGFRQHQKVRIGTVGMTSDPLGTQSYCVAACDASVCVLSHYFERAPAGRA